MMVFLLLGLIFLPMIIEARLAAANERTQRLRGGIEPPGDVYRVMRMAYPGAFILMVAEGAVCGGPTPQTFAAGIVVFGAAKALKWWAICTLGSSWTFRVIVVPHVPLVRSGPYRFARHPNYIAVVGELVGVLLMTRARLTGPLATVAFSLLMCRRIAIETRALVLYSGDHSKA
jgi:methyltransferase